MVWDVLGGIEISDEFSLVETSVATEFVVSQFSPLGREFLPKGSAVTGFHCVVFTEKLQLPTRIQQKTAVASGYTFSFDSDS